MVKITGHVLWSVILSLKGIHSISAQAKPYIPWVLTKVFVVLIKPLLLSTIGRVCNHIFINLAVIVPPCHERDFLRV